ncbi:MAG TPA: 50S ribosomal protein L23 [Phycisphaerales bacterium]|nr:50S ribosomal protein L23 [Phycisphaerales bacterium]
MHAADIIKKPLLTEKSTFLSNEAKQYCFLVASNARKDQIKQAVQELYRVRVVGISTMNRRAPDRRNRYGLIEGKWTKKAIVRIHPEDTIELF